MAQALFSKENIAHNLTLKTADMTRNELVEGVSFYVRSSSIELLNGGEIVVLNCLDSSQTVFELIVDDWAYAVEVQHLTDKVLMGDIKYSQGRYWLTFFCGIIELPVTMNKSIVHSLIKEAFETDPCLGSFCDKYFSKWLSLGNWNYKYKYAAEIAIELLVINQLKEASKECDYHTLRRMVFATRLYLNRFSESNGLLDIVTAMQVDLLQYIVQCINNSDLAGDEKLLDLLGREFNDEYTPYVQVRMEAKTIYAAQKRELQTYFDGSTSLYK